MTTPPGVTVVIADDHPLFRVALRLGVLNALPQARVIEVQSLHELTEVLRSTAPIELVLLDLTLADAEGLVGLQTLRREWPGLRVAVVSGARERGVVRATEVLGAVAFVPKATSASAMQEIIARVLAGQSWWPPAPAESPVTADRPRVEDRLALLSRQEMRVLLQIKDGALNKQIADALGISESTVKTHITALLRKLDLRSRTQAAVLAQQLLVGS